MSQPDTAASRRPSAAPTAPPSPPVAAPLSGYITPARKTAQDTSPNGQREAPDPTPILLAGVIRPRSAAYIARGWPWSTCVSPHPSKCSTTANRRRGSMAWPTGPWPSAGPSSGCWSSMTTRDKVAAAQAAGPGSNGWSPR